jgi:DNA-binding GntR family transcriptional regulator
MANLRKIENARMNGDQRISPRSLEQQAVDVIRSGILSGRYPGGRLTETRLADDLGLSRGTIRGALQELTHEGLVALSPYRGWSVVSLSSKDAWEIYTLRNTLEGLATKIVAENITSDVATQIRQSLEALRLAVRSGRRERIIRSDFELHRTIIEMSRHSRLLNQYKIIETQTLMFVAMAGAFHDVANYIALHEELVQAIVRGDADLAQKLAANHNTVDGRELVKRLTALETEAQASV